MSLQAYGVVFSVNRSDYSAEKEFRFYVWIVYKRILHDFSYRVGLVAKQVIFFGAFAKLRRLDSSCLSVCLSIHLSVCLSVHVCPSAHLPVRLFVRPSVCSSVRLFVCLSIRLSVRLFVCLSVCLSVCSSVSVRLSVRLSLLWQTKAGRYNQPNDTRWPEALCAELGGSWWWAQECPKHVQRNKNTIKF
jgi:hypothetical protein